jgi:cytochrome c553
MRKTAILIVVVLLAPVCNAADLAAGRAKVAAVCAACHGLDGVSVGESIPNLAAQRAGYLEAQLKALRQGTRKNPVMNAIASQLSDPDIVNVAAYFAAQPGAPTGVKSALLPNLAKTRVTFPDGYKNTFVRYHSINSPANKRVQHFFANDVAVQAARAGKPLPDGSVLLVEAHSAKLDAAQGPVVGADGFYAADKLLFYTAMARGASWGDEIPEMLRNGDWNYAVFTEDKQHRPGINQAECLACHKPLESSSYTFTVKQLAASK